MSDAADAPVHESAASVVPAAAVCAGTAGLLAAWISAGSVGLLAEPLRTMLVCCALGLALILQTSFRSLANSWLVAVLAMLALPLLVPRSPEHDVLSVAAVLAWLASGRTGAIRRILATCAAAAFVLAIYRTACLSIPIVWLSSNVVGGGVGSLAARLVGRPLDIGPTFAGLDFLVVMVAFLAGWFFSMDRPRWSRLAWAIFSVGVAHLLYLGVLTHSIELLRWLPESQEPAQIHPYVPPPWSWADALRSLIPWNVLAVAALTHLTVAASVLRWGQWSDASEPEEDAHRVRQGHHAVRSRYAYAYRFAPWLLAALFPVASVLSLGEPDLQGKRLVAFGQSGDDWKKPRHDRYGAASAEGFGMLQPLVESLGGRLVLSAQLSDGELAKTDVLLLLNVTDSLAKADRDRIDRFVRGGGSLLVVGGPLPRRAAWEQPSNAVLPSSSVAFRHDVAISATGDWQHAFQKTAHPATCGLKTGASYFFTDGGSSLRIGFPASPLVIGRWGWSDPGSDALLTGKSRFEPQERLGDLVLAAERRWGAGTMIVVGDRFDWTNEGCVRGYPWIGRVLSYLAHRPSSPSAGWRQAAGLTFAAALLGLVWSLGPRLCGVALCWQSRWLAVAT